jgi:Kef-type K+ transport system membrane component KefB
VEILLAFSILLAIATAFAIALQRLKISPIVGYIATGLLVGPVLGLIDPQSEFVSLFSNVGIALISFQVGLTAKLGFMRRYGLALPIVATLELAFVVLMTSLIGISADLPATLIYVLILISINTSTAIAFKLLEGKGQIGTPSATLIFACATVEDLIVIAGISFIPSIANFGSFGLREAMYSASFLVFVTLLMLVVGLQIFPWILNRIAKQGSMEIPILFTLTLAIGYGWAGSFVGASFALGAFLAGLIVSTTHFQEVLASGITPLRDIFAMIFFVSIGLNIPYLTETGLIYAFVLALMVILVKYVSFSSASWLAGFRLNEALRMGLYMIPISEFALIVSLEAFNYGLVDQNLLFAATLVVLLTVMLGSGLTRNDVRIADALSRAVPTRLQAEVNALTSWTIRNFNRWFYIEGSSKILSNIVKKILVIVILLSLGTIGAYALSNLPIESVLLELAQLAVIAAVSIISLIEVFSFKKDAEQLSAVLLISKDASTKEKLTKIMKNGLYLLVIIIIVLFLGFNAAVFLRGILQNYFESTLTNLIVFLFVCGLVSGVIVSSYPKIKEMLSRLEKIMDLI